MITKALVIDTADADCEVLVYREEACGSCSGCTGCDAKPTRYWIPNALQAEVGDLVTLSIDNGNFFLSIFHLYVLPLLLFLAGTLLVATWLSPAHPDREVLSVLGGLVGLGVYFLIGRLTHRRMAKKLNVQMVAKQAPEEE